MRTVKWNSFLSCLMALGMMTASARADVTVEEGASILIFPKVIVAGPFDTVIQLTNISNDLVFATCFYVNAQLTNPNFPEHPILNPPLWLETDFLIRLTRQQPTHWVVSEGRPVNPFDACMPDPTDPGCIPIDGIGVDLNGLGIDPGAVPPVPPDFVGELKCIETDASGTPIGGNHLKGEVTIFSEDGEVSKYNAVGIKGTDLAGQTGRELLLNNPTGENIGQYDACPAELILNHFAEGEEDESEEAPRPQEIIPGDSVTTELTIVPCSEDLENQRPASVILLFKIYNEFEAVLSFTTTVTCWANFNLSDLGNVFEASVLGSDVAQTFITPTDNTQGSVVAVAEEFHSEEGDISRAAFNVHTRGNHFFGPDGELFDRVRIPDLF
jgi:hypothetical protein